MAGWENLFTPSAETIRGISDRTGMNLPDLPYGGIMSLLTGGPIGLATHYAANNVIPAIANAVNSDVGSLMDQRSQPNDYLLDQVFGKMAMPESDTFQVPWWDLMGVKLDPFEGTGGNYNPDAMQAYGVNPSGYTISTADYLKSILGDPSTGGVDIGGGFEPADMPSFEMQNIGSDFEKMPDFSQFDFQDSMPSFDYTDFDFRRGGKV